MVLLMWCVWGGFLPHILECNYLTVLVKPVYEKPVDTAEDIIERGIKVLQGPASGSMVEINKKSPFPLTRALAEIAYVTKVVILQLIFIFRLNHNFFSFKSRSEFNDLLRKWVAVDGTAVFVSSTGRSRLRLHRSKGKVQKNRNDFASYMINKKWWLEEQFNLHMMRFQQVELSVNQTI